MNKIILGTSIFALTQLAQFTSTAFAAEPKPNIVYFLMDDMGFADAGFNGCKDIKTPNLDKFAEQGAVLDCFYGQPVCSPTRACLMTGRYPTRTGVYNTVQYRMPAPWSLPLKEQTMAQMLKTAGYTTAICGKWHLGDDSPDYLPTKRGFDHQYGFMGGGISSFIHQGAKNSDDWYRDDQPCDDKGYSMFLIADEACRIIHEQPAGKPLFLYVAPNSVHTPWLSPKEYEKPYENLSDGRKKLAGMTAAADEAFKQIMEALKEKGLIDNTIVIFTSDNGGVSWTHSASNYPFRGGKSDIYEGGFRLGAFVWCPGKIPAGIRIAEPLHIVDWYPTLAKLTGANLDQKLPLDGKNIWPVLTKGAKTPHKEILLMGSRPAQQAIRVGDWKLLVNPLEFREKTISYPIELYNVVDDPSEKKNLANQFPEKVKLMQERLKTYTVNSANEKFLQLPAESEVKEPGKKGDEE